MLSDVELSDTAVSLQMSFKLDHARQSTCQIRTELAYYLARSMVCKTARFETMPMRTVQVGERLVAQASASFHRDQ
jgi:hypothetical protein